MFSDMISVNSLEIVETYDYLGTGNYLMASAFVFHNLRCSDMYYNDYS